MKPTKTLLLSTGLFLSVLGNLALGGMLAGRYYAEHQRSQHFLMSPLRLAREMPPAERERLKGIIDPAEAALKNKHAALRQQRDRIRALILAKQVNAKQLESAFNEYRHLIGDMQNTLQALMIKLCLTLPLEERQKMVHTDTP